MIRQHVDGDHESSYLGSRPTPLMAMIDATKSPHEADATMNLLLEKMDTLVALSEKQNALHEKQNILLGEISAALAGQSRTSDRGSEREAKLQRAREGPLGGPRELFVKMLIERIFNLHTIEQTFNAQVLITFHWHLPLTEDPPSISEDDGDWTPSWTPKFRLRSIVETEFVCEQYTIVQFMGETMIKGEIRMLVKVHEILELSSFPFDCQNLPIVLESKMSSELVRFRPHPDEDKLLTGIFRNSHLSKHLHQAAMVMEKHCTLDDFQVIKEMPYTARFFLEDLGDREMPSLAIVVKAVRKSSYYLLNVACFYFMIVSLAFCAWYVHPADLDVRLNIDFALILTAVAMKVVLNEFLPNTGYITRLDTYVLLCCLFLTGVTVCHASLPHIEYTKLDMSALTLPPMSIKHEPDLILDDMYTFWIVGASWISFNAVFWLFLKCAAIHEYKRFWQDAEKLQSQYDASFRQCTAGTSFDSEPVSPDAPKSVRAPESITPEKIHGTPKSACDPESITSQNIDGKHQL